MTFSLLLTSVLVVVQIVAKIPERVTLPGSVSMFFFARALLILGVSTVVSAIASACGIDGPYSRFMKTGSHVDGTE